MGNLVGCSFVLQATFALLGNFLPLGCSLPLTVVTVFDPDIISDCNNFFKKECG